MKIGYRTIKTAIGAPISIFLAQLFQVDFFVSAGILTILCIQPTRKRSVNSSLARMSACMLGIAYSYLFFELLGYNVLSIGLLIAMFLPVLVYLKIQTGFITSVVIIFHIYTLQVLNWPIVFNELKIMVIGIGMALLLNLYMPSVENVLRKHQQTLENYFSIILKELAYYLQQGESNWSGKEFLQAEDLIKAAKELAMKDIENHFIKPNESYYFYFTMRERQFDVLTRMLPIISALNQHVEQSQLVADYLLFLSEKINPKDTVSESISRLVAMQEQFKRTELPKTREEFEARAALHHLTSEIAQYLKIKEESFMRKE